MSDKLFFTEMGLLVGGVSTIAISQVLSTVCLFTSAVIGIFNLVSTIRRAMRDGKITKEEQKEILEQTKSTITEIDNAINEVRENHKDE